MKTIVNTEPDKCFEWKWFKWDNLPAPLMQGIERLSAKGLNPFDL